MSVYTAAPDTTEQEPLPVLVITPERNEFVDDEPVILDASCSGGTITKYEWFADGESVSDSSTMDQYFPLDAEESSKDVAVRLEITTLE